jgi:HSP20 family molecular chaperone IbpA
MREEIMSQEKTMTVDNTGARLRPSAERVQSQKPYAVPPVDVYEGADSVQLVADLPGVAKENVIVSFDKGELTIEGRRSESAGGSLLAAEFRAADFRRTFALPAGIDASKITAQFEQGVLRLTLPKSDALKPRRIEIKAS